jgi:hypothetical protein
MYAAHAYNIRKSTEADESGLRRLAELDSQRALTGEALVAEIDGKPAAAISLADGLAETYAWVYDQVKRAQG